MATLPPDLTTDERLAEHLSTQVLPDYLDTLEDEQERQWASRVYGDRLRPLPPDPDEGGQNDQGADDQGANDDQGAAAPVYDADLYQDQNYQPLNGQFEFEVLVDSPFYARLGQGGTYVCDVRNRANLPGGAEGVVDMQQGVSGEWRVTVGALSKAGDEAVNQRNKWVFEALVVGCAVGEQRWANAFYNLQTGLVLAAPDETFDAPTQMGPDVAPGQVTFTRSRVGANALKVHGGISKNVVAEALQKLLDDQTVNYPFRDRSRVKPG